MRPSTVVRLPAQVENNHWWAPPAGIHFHPRFLGIRSPLVEIRIARVESSGQLARRRTWFRKLVLFFFYCLRRNIGRCSPVQERNSNSASDPIKLGKTVGARASGGVLRRPMAVRVNPRRHRKQKKTKTKRKPDPITTVQHGSDRAIAEKMRFARRNRTGGADWTPEQTNQVSRRLPSLSAGPVWGSNRPCTVTMASVMANTKYRDDSIFSCYPV